ncbi:tRNA pseudouridine synthase 3 [Actinomortierella ambigua]|uniref:tRNA pseudouridine synthase 3 n=1 Tax=Actinomortierella ambigua TaxID=1343610 RepID=A0A9P6PNM3_9FUNG|nr:tRNA pseudouridine synthase 3 [Actinomortierella ambigua]
MTDHTDKHNHTTHFTNKYNLRDTPYDLRESTLDASISSERKELENAHQHHAQFHTQADQQVDHANNPAHGHGHSHQHQQGGSPADHGHPVHLTKEEQKLPPVQLATGTELNIEHPVDPSNKVTATLSPTPIALVFTAPAPRPFSTLSAVFHGRFAFSKQHRRKADNTPFLDRVDFSALKSNSAVSATRGGPHNQQSTQEIGAVVDRSCSHTIIMPTNKDGSKSRKHVGGSGQLQIRARTATTKGASVGQNNVIDQYSTWSREDLLARVRELDQQVVAGRTLGAASSLSSSPVVTSLSSTPASPIVTAAATPGEDGVGEESTASGASTPRPHGKKNQRPFDFSKYAKRHIAFRVAYFGWNYGGFALQGTTQDGEHIKTVESELFNAFLAARLIEDPQNCNYSRCGRTDKGVSGLGQVVALTVRSSFPKNHPDVIPEPVDEGGDCAEGGSETSTPMTADEALEQAGVKVTKGGIKRDKHGHVQGELAYLNILNRLLPPDIRVVAWAPVKPTFDARFDCLWREYKYFFPRGFIDVDKMRAASQKFLGMHDFQNFCKYDASKTITVYDRTIMEISIEPVQDYEFAHGTNTEGILDPSRQFYELRLKGSAFLWHQVRCIMSVLFAIGQGLEEPDVIDTMFDLEKCPAKPSYDMAADLPLVLYDCHFEGLDWRYQTDTDQVQDFTPMKLYRAFEDQWSCHVTKALMYANMMNLMETYEMRHIPEKGNKTVLGPFARENIAKENNISLGADLRMFIGKRYSPLLQRKMCLPTAVKSKRHQEKKRLKLEAEAATSGSSAAASPAPAATPSQAMTPEATMTDAAAEAIPSSHPSTPQSS